MRCMEVFIQKYVHFVEQTNNSSNIAISEQFKELLDKWNEWVKEPLDIPYEYKPIWQVFPNQIMYDNQSTSGGYVSGTTTTVNLPFNQTVGIDSHDVLKDNIFTKKIIKAHKHENTNKYKITY